MTKIAKSPSAKHEATLSPFLRDYVAKATSLTDAELLPYLKTFPVDWPFQRGDLYHWIPLLNRFDGLLEELIVKYKLKDGPQAVVWQLEDKELLIGILSFSKLLLENCGNRSLYSSSMLLNDLLNTTDLDVLIATLSLMVRLAQRYHTSRTRTPNGHSSLLISHYNINLERVAKLGSSFVKSISTSNSGGKGSSNKAVLPTYNNDLARIARDEKPVSDVHSGKGKGKAKEDHEGSWDEWGGAWISYYTNTAAASKSQTPASTAPKDPATPSPARRTLQRSNTHPHHLTTPSSSSKSKAGEEPEPDSGGLHTLEVPYNKIKESSSLEELVSSYLPDIPADHHYEFLHRIRVAYALSTSTETRRKILAVRILALTNLAYVYNETQFTTKIGQPDQDEPKRLQVVHQLAELLQSNEGPAKKGSDVPRWLQTLALGALESFAKHKSRQNDVCQALNANINHGILLYIMRKAVAELGDDSYDDLESEEWRDVLFSLITFLPNAQNAGQQLVSAGVIPIMIEILQLRTKKVLRYLPKALSLVDQLNYSVQNAFQVFANSKGLDTLVDLVADQVSVGAAEVKNNEGIVSEYRTSQIDYKVGHYRQATIKMSFKFMQHLMSQSSAHTDRLLRNLIDNAKLLESLNLIIGNPTVWGSMVWSTVMGMLSSFIHNEPTSYAVIHEAKVTHTFLETVTGISGLAEKEARAKKKEERDAAKAAQQAAQQAEVAAPSEAAAPAEGQPEAQAVEANPVQPDPIVRTEEPEEPEEPEPDTTNLPIPPLSSRIMPTIDAITALPTAFGAIGLNASGLKLFQMSGALEAFFRIFESQEHIKALCEGDVSGLLGTQFDELVRHHPTLRESVVNATLEMLKAVREKGDAIAENRRVGAKIWLEDDGGDLFVSGGLDAVMNNEGVVPLSSPSPVTHGDDGHSETGQAGVVTSTVAVGETRPDSAAPYNKVVRLSDCEDEENNNDADRESKELIAPFIDAVSRYLEGFLSNSNIARDFLAKDGLQHLLTFLHIPSLPYNFASSEANQMLSRVINMCCEQDLGQTLKGVFKHCALTMDTLEPLIQHSRDEAFFAPFTRPARAGSTTSPRPREGMPSSNLQPEHSETEAERQSIQDLKGNGTFLIKGLITMHSLCFILQEIFSTSLFSGRPSVQAFFQTTEDIDKDGFLSKLGTLHRQCLWEEILLSKAIPEEVNDATKIKDSPAVTSSAAQETAHTATDGPSANAESSKSAEQKEAEKSTIEKQSKTAWFRNVKTIRFLIGQMPASIIPFFQGLTKSVLPRRTSDLSIKRIALRLVDSVADSLYSSFTWERMLKSTSDADKFNYWCLILNATAQLLLDGLIPNNNVLLPKHAGQDRGPAAITGTLLIFKQKGGLDALKEVLMTFWAVLQKHTGTIDYDQLSPADKADVTIAYTGSTLVLDIFSYLVLPRAVVDSAQSTALSTTRTMASSSSRSDFFNPIQLLVELRAAILPSMRDMWESKTIDKANSALVKSVIKTIGNILKADSEAPAFTREMARNKPDLNNELRWQRMAPSNSDIQQLVDMGFPRERVITALMTCNFVVGDAATYLSSNAEGAARWRTPLPAEDDDGGGEDVDDDDEDSTRDEDMLPPGPAPAETDVSPAVSAAEATVATSSNADISASGSSVAPSNTEASAPQSEAPVTEDISMTGEPSDETPKEDEGATVGSKGKEKEGEDPTRSEVTTVEDLEDLRNQVRESLITRSLDILQDQVDVTFDLAELIKSAFSKSNVEMRKEVASTVVCSLMTLLDEDFRPKAKVIASTAHLLGLILQDSQFYQASVEDLQEQIPVLVGFIKIYPGEPAPWIANILLVVEKLLSESAQPEKVKFRKPDADNEEAPAAENTAIRIPHEEQESIFDALIDILPNVETDTLLPLAVVRVLALLTRSRQLALKMTENENLHKFCRMIRRQSGLNIERVQASAMLVFRHIIEDEATLKQSMSTIIRAQFSRQLRQLDTGSFLKVNSHLVLRNPEVFVNVVNDICKVTKYDGSLRYQHLTLKETTRPKPKEEAAPTEKPEGDKKEGDAEAVTEASASESKEEKTPEKVKPTDEITIPGVEKPDGVIHFLLTEMLSLKGREDTSELKVDAPPADNKPKDKDGDVQMTTEDAVVPEKPAEPEKKTDKPQFKSEEHPVFFYRCFLLQSTAELLSSYNRCKVEFINYNKKANPREPIAPSKPRSGILNYLLHDLIPQDTLATPEDIPHKKKASTSHWAMATLVALVTYTKEFPSHDDEPKNAFVRKFVLETSLKAFKDAMGSTEPLDKRYAKLLNLADLFNRFLTVKQDTEMQALSPDKCQEQLAKIMLEKNFVSALTSALADIDLNFPSAKRAVKYVLKPLKALSKMAIDLGESSEFSTPGATDDDEISTASSVSDEVDDDREETPDLYRNSALGMMEGGDIDEDSSDYDEDEDEEMELYDEEIYDDDILDDEEGSDSSDEEEGDEGDADVDAGPMEIVIEGEDGEDSDDDDDDSDTSEDLDEDENDVAMEGEQVEEYIDEFGPNEGGEEEGWESDGNDDEAHDEDDMLNESPLDNIVRAIGLNGEPGDLDMEEDPEPFMDDEGDEDDLEIEEDDDDMDEEDEAMMQDDFDDDEGALAIPGWEDPGMGFGARAQRRGAAGGWFTLTGPREPPVFMARGSRPSGRYMSDTAQDRTPSTQEQNPLLQPMPSVPRDRGNHLSYRSRHPMPEFGVVGPEWNQMLNASQPPVGAVTMLSTLMNLMNRGGPLPNGSTISFSSNIPPRFSQLNRAQRNEVTAGFSLWDSSAPGRHHREDPAQVLTFQPQQTSTRWSEEARLLFGASYTEIAQNVTGAVLTRLVPPALEEEKIRKEKEEILRKEKEEKERKEEEERLEKEKAEREEKERKEQEEKEAAERAAAAEAEARAAELAAQPKTEVQADAQVEGAETTEATVQEAEGGADVAQPEEANAGPSEPVERVTIMIRGREMDITGMGMDPEFLEALPEDMREEVLTQHIRERRAAATTDDQPTDISREFLEALPEEIRVELLTQEAADRRRREQEASRQQGAGGPVDMDLATLLASIDPNLRQTILLEQDDETLAGLPREIVEEANALRGDHPHRAAYRSFGDARVGRAPNRPDEPKDVKKPSRRGVVQLVDKAGVATLLRLMFIPQVGSTRTTLHEILLNICENKQNRAEVINILLSILQDGSVDMMAVDRSFAQLSLKAKQTPATPGKSPNMPPLKRTNTNPTPSLLVQSSGEISPLTVTQQCLQALTFLVTYNVHIPPYFLSEHEGYDAIGLRRSASRKGKGKAVESKANKFALNTLLLLLDRSLITESASVMDQLISLLSEITRPLVLLLKKDKKEDEPKEEKPATDAPQVTAASASEPATETSAETTTATETSTQAPAPDAAQTSAQEVVPPAPDVAMVDASAEASAATEPSTDSNSTKKPEEEKPKKKAVPPVVPEHNLRLVVNILATREVPAKTFRDVITTMQNLCGIPSAKDVFGTELIQQAQRLGSIIMPHLDELLQQIKEAENGTQVQGMALANFSPSSSDQTKLLRILTALDFLFDPTRIAKVVTSTLSKEEKEQVAKEEADTLANLYDSLTFEPLWNKLSDCLAAIHERGEMLLHVATILLPLIESLMVVCKNTGLKDFSPPQHPQVLTSAVPMSPSRIMAPNKMAEIFFRFTEDHRKILNSMVRNNPKLMSGSFALLVNNPKVLDFDNKRNYFSRRLHTRGARDPHPTLQLNIRRDQCFMDSYRSMYYKTGDEIKLAKLSIRFHGEEGVDAGGVTREWFQVMARQMFNPNYALWTPVASDRTTFHPNKASNINSEHLSFFKFIGRVIGKAIYETRVLDCHFSRAVYKRLLGKPVTLKDMESLDVEYYKSLQWMADSDITDIITETFSVELDEFGARQVVELKENGLNIAVTEENKHEYLSLLVEYRLLSSVKEQMESFLQGFHDIVPPELVSIFNEQELELLISGLPEINVDDWRNNTDYHNYSASSPQIQWFWRAVRSFDKEERAKLLQFVTGTSKVPLNGFKELEGMNGFSKFNIHRDYGNKDRLPSSHTCFNQLDLPEYETYEALRKQLLTAITQGAEYFGFA